MAAQHRRQTDVLTCFKQQFLCKFCYRAAKCLIDKSNCASTVSRCTVTSISARTNNNLPIVPTSSGRAKNFQLGAIAQEAWGRISPSGAGDSPSGVQG